MFHALSAGTGDPYVCIGCEFVKGWFKDTLPRMEGSILLAFLDVDLEASLHTCVRYIWPHLVEKGFIFIERSRGG